MFSVYSARVSKSARLLIQPADLHPLSLLFFLVKWGGMKLTLLLLLIFTAAMVSGSRLPEHQHMNNNEDSSQENTILSITLTLALLVFCAIKFRLKWPKCKKVAIALSVLQNIREAKAATVPSFIYKNDKPTEQSPQFFLERIDMSIEHYILVLCICTLVLLIIISIYIFKCRRNKTMLLAEITNGELCVHIPLKRLSVCPTYWTIKSPSDVLSITIRGKRSPTIEFQWDCFTITNQLTNKTFNIKTFYSVSWFSGRKLRKILATAYSVHFFIQHENLLLPISYKP